MQINEALSFRVSERSLEGFTCHVEKALRSRTQVGSLNVEHLFIMGTFLDRLVVLDESSGSVFELPFVSEGKSFKFNLPTEIDILALDENFSEIAMEFSKDLKDCLAVFKTPRKWQRQLESRRADFRRYMYGELGEVEQQMLQPKYWKAYKGLATDRVIPVREEVVKSFDDLFEKAKDLQQKFSKGIDETISMIEDEMEDEGAHSTRQFVKLYQDAAEHLEDMFRALDKAKVLAKVEKSVEALGYTYDSMVEMVNEMLFLGRTLEKFNKEVRKNEG